MADPSAADLLDPPPISARMRVALAVLFGISLVQAVAMVAGGRAHNNDFKHLWLGARILADGGDPYDPALMFAGARQYELGAINPYVYLPATGLLMRPLAAIPFGAASAVWFWMNWALAWACALWGPRLLRAPSRDVAALAGALFIVGGFPFYRQMTAGQMNVALWAALLLSVGWLIQGRSAAAGVVLGLAAAFKIAPLFLIVVLFSMRRYRAFAASVAAFGAMMALAFVLYGADVHLSALSTMREMSYGRSTWSQFGMAFHRDPFNQSFNALFHHLFAGSGEGPGAIQPWVDLGPSAANIATYLASGILLAGAGFALLRYRRRPYFSESWGEPETGLFLSASLLMLLLPSLMWDHYVVQALPALVWVIGSGAFTRRPALLVPLVVVFFLLAYPWRHQAEAYRSGFGLLLMSIRLWGMLGLFALVDVLRSDRMRARLT